MFKRRPGQAGKRAKCSSWVPGATKSKGRLSWRPLSFEDIVSIRLHHFGNALTSDEQPEFHEPKKRPQRLRGTGAGTVKGRCHVSDRHGIIIREHCHLFPMQKETGPTRGERRQPEHGMVCAVG